MERGGAFYIVSAKVAVVSAEIDIAIMLRNAQVAALCGQGKRKLLWQLQVKIKAGLFEVTAGEVKQPDAALLDELGPRRFIQAVGALLGIAPHGLANNGVDLIVFTGGDVDIAPGGEDFYFRTTGERLGKIVSEVIVLAEPVAPLGISAHFVADTAPVPVGG